MKHELKLKECFADAVLSGEKSFEVRNTADRVFQKGDTVEFTVVDEYGLMLPHPLDLVTFEITYVLSGWGLKEGYVAFGIKIMEGLE